MAKHKESTTSGFGTGGGGITFEHRVQAYYLVTMLINGQFPGLEFEYRQIKSLRLQFTEKEQTTDDLTVVVVDTLGVEHKLFAQIKHKMTFTPGDKATRKALTQAWRDFTQNSDVKEGNAKVAMISGPASQKMIDHLRPLLAKARAHAEFTTFSQSLSQGEKTYFNNIKAIIAAIDDIDAHKDEDIWHFCQVLLWQSYDLDYKDASEDWAKAIALMTAGMTEDAPKSARDIWLELLTVCAETNAVKGTLTRNTMPTWVKRSFRSYRMPVLDCDPWYVDALSQPEIFVGQQAYLEEVDRFLRSPRETNATQRLYLYGIAGGGKTFLAKQIFFQVEKQFNLRIWFNAEADLLEQFRQFAKQQRLLEEDDTEKAIQRKVKQWFQAHPGWLMVFDNVEDSRSLGSYIPATGGLVLVTTNRSHAVQSIRVDPMSDDDAVSCLTRYAYDDEQLSAEEAAIAKQLIERLDRLPLALAQAGAYIRCVEEMNFQTYLTRFEERKRELLSDDNLREEFDDKHVTVYATWDMSISYLRNVLLRPRAVELLNVLVWFGPDAIPLSLLAVADDDLDLLWLKRLSLIGRADGVINVHRVLRDVVQLKQKDAGSQQEFLDKALAALVNHFRYDRQDVQAMRTCASILPHAKVVLTEFEQGDNEFEGIHELYYQVGVFYLDYYNDAEIAVTYLEHALEYAQRAGAELTAIQRQLGKALTRTFASDRGIVLLEELLANDPDPSVGLLCDLATAYLFRKLLVDYTHYDIAELFQADGESVVDAEDAEADSRPKRSKIGSKIKRDENLKKAFEYLQKIETNQSTLAPATEARVKHMWGHYYRLKHNYLQAIKFFEEAKKLKEDLPDNARELARTCRELGITYVYYAAQVGASQLENLTFAVDCLQQSIDIQFDFGLLEYKIVDDILRLALVYERLSKSTLDLQQRDAYQAQALAQYEKTITLTRERQELANAAQIQKTRTAMAKYYERQANYDAALKALAGFNYIIRSCASASFALIIA